jgi:hypothetical protein
MFPEDSYRLCLCNFIGCNAGTTDMNCTTEMLLGVILCIPSFMSTGRGVQVAVRFCVSNLKGYNVGITYGKDYNVCH